MKKTLGLSRQMGLFAVIATGVSSMVGASINVVPFMIHRSVPNIGPYVLWAFAFAAIPALFAGLAYAILSSAMPRAGGSYLYASRGLNPYLGFVASFSQWFGLSIVIGVIAYISIPFLRDIAYSSELYGLAELLDISIVRVAMGLSLIWGFVYLNIRGIKSYTNLVDIHFVHIWGIEFLLNVAVMFGVSSHVIISIAPHVCLGKRFHFPKTNNQNSSPKQISIHRVNVSGSDVQHWSFGLSLCR